MLGMDFGDQSLSIAENGCVFKSIALQRLFAAIADPAGKLRMGAVKDFEQGFFVIAHQQVHLVDARRFGQQPLDDMCRLRAAINEIAEHDQMNRIGRVAAAFVGDPRKQRVEQVETAVNVADRIDARARRHLRPILGNGLGGRLAVEKSF